MNRGELYRVPNSNPLDPKRSRVYVIVSEPLRNPRLSTVICAPVYSRHDGLSTQVAVGVDEGLKHESSIHCDELVSLPKSVLTRFVGTLSGERLAQLKRALQIAVAIED